MISTRLHGAIDAAMVALLAGLSASRRVPGPVRGRPRCGVGRAPRLHDADRLRGRDLAPARHAPASGAGCRRWRGPGRGRNAVAPVDGVGTHAPGRPRPRRVRRGAAQRHRAAQRPGPGRPAGGLRASGYAQADSAGRVHRRQQSARRGRRGTRGADDGDPPGRWRSAAAFADALHPVAATRDRGARTDPSSGCAQFRALDVSRSLAKRTPRRPNLGGTWPARTRSGSKERGFASMPTSARPRRRNGATGSRQ